jgi:acyl dehydratase
MATTGAQARPHGKYFEELPLGEEWVSPGRTITEADLVAFAGFSGDYHPLHTDEEFAKRTQFGRRILHGAAVFGIATGLESRIGLKEGTALAFLGMTWDMKAPVFIGDTIYVRERVAEKRESRSKPDRGFVAFDVEVVNQRGEVVQAGQWKVLMLRQPAAS